MSNHTGRPLLRKDAARAADVPLETLTRWLDRKVIRLRQNDTRLPNGYRGFSRNRIIQIAIVAELTRLGVAAGRAAEAALHFTDVANWNRKPCELAPRSRGYLILNNVGTTRIASIEPDQSIADELTGETAAIVVDLTRITTTVDSRLRTLN